MSTTFSETWHIHSFLHIDNGCYLIKIVESFTVEKKTIQQFIIIKTAICSSCILHYERKNNYNHQLNNTQVAANNHYYCQQCKRMINLVDKRSHIQSDQLKNNKEMCFCQVCRKHTNNNIKPSYIKSDTQKRNEINSIIINNVTDKAITYLNPESQ